MYVVARNMCLALPGCCLAKHTFPIRHLCTVDIGCAQPED